MWRASAAILIMRIHITGSNSGLGCALVHVAHSASVSCNRRSKASEVISPGGPNSLRGGCNRIFQSFPSSPPHSPVWWSQYFPVH